MIKKSQVLSAVQQVKLHELELDVEALREEVQKQSNTIENSLLETNSNLVIYQSTPENWSHPT